MGAAQYCAAPFLCLKRPARAKGAKRAEKPKVANSSLKFPFSRCCPFSI